MMLVALVFYVPHNSGRSLTVALFQTFFNHWIVSRSNSRSPFLCSSWCYADILVFCNLSRSIHILLQVLHIWRIISYLRLSSSACFPADVLRCLSYYVIELSRQGFHIGATLRSFSLSSVLGLDVLVFLSLTLKFIISMSWAHPISAPGNILVVAVWSPIETAFAAEYNQFGYGKFHQVHAMFLHQSFCWPNLFANTIRLSLTNSSNLIPISFIDLLQKILTCVILNFCVWFSLYK